MDLLLKPLQARCESGLQLTTLQDVQRTPPPQAAITTAVITISDVHSVNPHSHAGGVTCFHILLLHTQSEAGSQLHDPHCFCPPIKFCHPKVLTPSTQPLTHALQAHASFETLVIPANWQLQGNRFAACVWLLGYAMGWRGGRGKRSKKTPTNYKTKKAKKLHVGSNST